MEGFTAYNDRYAQQNYIDRAVSAGYSQDAAQKLWAYYSTYQLIDGAKRYLSPYPYDALASVNTNTNAPPPPQFQNRITFDTIGQVIFRSIGHCRLPLKVIWAQGINESGDVTVSNTQTFAAALCAPIDPSEEIDIFSIWDAGSRVYDLTGALAPIGWTPEDIALLAASLSGILIYPGDESQLPAPLIVADKGASLTNAFRGLRYMIFPDYPIRGNGLPQLSVVIERTNAQPSTDDGAVDFLAGSS